MADTDNNSNDGSEQDPSYWEKLKSLLAGAGQQIGQNIDKAGALQDQVHQDYQNQYNTGDFTPTPAQQEYARQAAMAVSGSMAPVGGMANAAKQAALSKMAGSELGEAAAQRAALANEAGGVVSGNNVFAPIAKKEVQAAAPKTEQMMTGGFGQPLLQKAKSANPGLSDIDALRKYSESSNNWLEQQKLGQMINSLKQK